MKKKSLYVILPIVFFGVVHLTFCYGQNSFDMSTWHELTRTMAAFLGLVAIIGGVVAVIDINKPTP